MFDTPETWRVLLQFFIIAVAVLAGNILRRKVPFITRSLMPSALLGGLLILAFKLMPSVNELIDKRFMEVLTYHMLALGFIAMSLRTPHDTSKARTMTVIDTGAMTVGTYLVQGLTGLLVTIPLFMWWRNPQEGYDIFYSGGMLLPMGFGQGPGQALNFGTIYQQAAQDQGITFWGIDFGLSIAAIGFILGSLVGVVYMNILRRKGKLKAGQAILEEKHTIQDYEGQNELPDSESVDKFTIVISIVLMTYGMVYALMHLIGKLDLGTFGEKTLMPLVYGFNFLWGIIFGTLVRLTLKHLRSWGFMHRVYLNNYMLNRMSGVCFDLMIVAGTAAISFENMKSFILPLAMVCTLGCVTTFIYIRLLSRRLYPGYADEGFFSMFGMLTGTASNGMILLREIDPRYETPAANNLVLQSIPAMAMGFPILLLLGIAPRSMNATLTVLGIMVVLFIGLTLFLLRKRK